MQAPREGHMVKLKRLARCLPGNRRQCCGVPETSPSAWRLGKSTQHDGDDDQARQALSSTRLRCRYASDCPARKQNFTRWPEERLRPLARTATWQIGGVIKKERPHGNRQRKTGEQIKHCIAHNLRKRCIKKNFEGIHDCFQKD